MNKDITVNFTEQEALALRNLLHVACKAEGMGVAQVCVVLDQKILAAAKAAQEEAPQ